MKSFHNAAQVDSALWSVTFVSELGYVETRVMTSAEFIDGGSPARLLIVFR
jgi:hypothetical protein